MLSDSLGWAASGISSSERVPSVYDCSGEEGEGGFIILPELETRSYPARLFTSRTADSKPWACIGSQRSLEDAEATDDT